MLGYQVMYFFGDIIKCIFSNEKLADIDKISLEYGPIKLEYLSINSGGGMALNGNYTSAEAMTT